MTGTLAGGTPATPLVPFFTGPFFRAMAVRLNGDPAWRETARGLTTRVVLACTDRGVAFLLDVRDGRIAVGDASGDTPSDFRFETDYVSWVAIMHRETDYYPLVKARRMRFRGSVFRLRLKMKPMDAMTDAARETPAAY